MNLAYVFAHIEPTGGDRICYYHIKGLLDAGHSVDIYYKGFFKTYYKDREFASLEIKKYFKLYSGSDLYDYDFSKYDYIVGSGVYGAGAILSIKDKLKVWFSQNLDRYVFINGCPDVNLHIPYIYHKNLMTYSKPLCGLIRHYYGDKNFILCNNGVEYDLLRPYSKTDKINNKQKRVVYMSAYNGILKGTRLARDIFEELKSRGYTTVSISMTPSNLLSADEFYYNPDFDKKCQIIAGCDVLIHTSIFETWGLVAMESMALGTPVVGYDSLGFTEYATSENAIILKERNAKLFCDEINRLVHDFELYNKLLINGIKTASDHNWTRVMPEIIKSYESWMEVV